MNDPTVPQTVLFPDLFDRPLVATFDQAHSSSDGGAILLKAADRSLGLITALAEALPDPRAATRVTHPWSDMLAQRIFGIAHRLSRCQRRRRLGGRPDPEARARSRSDHGRATGIAAHGVALRECDQATGALRPGRGADRHRDRPPPSAEAPFTPHHDRPRRDRGRDAWGPATDVLQRLLRRVVLPAAAGLPDPRRRAAPVSGRGGAAPGQRRHRGGGARPAAAPHPQNCRQPFPAPASGSAWTAASPRPRSSTNSRPPGSSTSSPWRRIRCSRRRPSRC